MRSKKIKLFYSFIFAFLIFLYCANDIYEEKRNNVVLLNLLADDDNKHFEQEIISNFPEVTSAFKASLPEDMLPLKKRIVLSFESGYIPQSQYKVKIKRYILSLIEVNFDEIEVLF